MGPCWAGPENIRSSNILSTSATSMVTRNLKTLGIPLARDFDLGSSIPNASQKFRMSFRVDRNTRCSNSSAARLSTAPRGQRRKLCAADVVAVMLAGGAVPQGGAFGQVLEGIAPRRLRRRNLAYSASPYRWKAATRFWRPFSTIRRGDHVGDHDSI